MNWSGSNWWGSNWWPSNWFAGTGVAPDPTTSVEERILDQIVTRLQAITVGGGYEQTVIRVTRASVAPAPLEVPAAELPALQVRHIATRDREHLRDAYEFVMDVQIVVIVAQGDERLADLKADVEKVVHANRRWHDGTEYLARRTWINDPISHETEVQEQESTAVIPLSIVARHRSNSPYVVKAV